MPSSSSNSTVSNKPSSKLILEKSVILIAIRYGALSYNSLACGGVNNMVVPPIILLSATSIPNLDSSSLVSISVL